MSVPLLALGPHIFQVDSLNFQSLRRKTETKAPEIDRFGARNATQITGLKRGSITISGLLFPEEFNDREAYEALRTTQEAGAPVVLMGWAVGTGIAAEIFGMVTILSISDNQTSISRAGHGRRIEYTVELAGA